MFVPKFRTLSQTDMVIILGAIIRLALTSTASAGGHKLVTVAADCSWRRGSDVLMTARFTRDPAVH
jgi:hypothetical protein